MRVILDVLLRALMPLGFAGGGGGGGDGGAEEMRQQEADRQRKVQQAVDAINAKFGVGQDVSLTAPPTLEQFTVGSPSQIGASPYLNQVVAQSTDQIGTKLYPGAENEGFFGPSIDQVAAPPTDQIGTKLYPGAENEGFFGSAINDVVAQSNYKKALDDYNAKKNGGTPVADAKAAREKMYADISGAVTDTAMRDLDRQFTTASRQNKFGLARSGLLGGSADAEAGGDLSTRYGEGKIKATQAGIGAASDLRNTDEQTRQHLISLAQSGLDTGTAASLADGQMASAASLAKSQAATASAGRLFDDMSQAYLTNKVMSARYPNGLPQQAATSSYSTSVFSPSRYTGVASK